MNNLKYWQEKIQEKRKQTSFRDFIKEIASWQPIVFHKSSWMVSRFPETERMPEVMKYSDYYNQSWEEYLNGIDYDSSKNLFENYAELRKSVKGINMINFFHSENSEYADVVSKWKNIYLSAFIVNGDEDVMYSFGVNDESKRVLNSAIISDHSENIYFSLAVQHSFQVFYSRFINNSSDIWLSTNLIWCTHCIACHDLENSSYCIENTQYEKDEYMIKKDEYLKDKDGYHKSYTDLIRKRWKHLASANITWSYAVESEDIEWAHFTYRISSWRNIFNVWGFESCQNIYDVFNWWGPSLQDIYAVNGIAINSENCYTSCHVPNCNTVFYSYYLESCSFCIWCIGLQNKSYCILNKQYTKDEWELKANEIFSQMEKEDVLWDFFPGSLNPFYFNDTMGWILWNFTKDEVESEGYMWREWEIKVDIPEESDIISTNDLKHYQSYQDEKWLINKNILKKVIQDDNGNYYRIVQMEYDFLSRYWLPLPEIHWLDRMKLNLWIKN